MNILPLALGRQAIRQAQGVFYGWWLVSVGIGFLTLAALLVFQGLGTFVVALERQFGWSRTALSGAFSLARGESAVLGPIEGLLINRFGCRTMVLVGFTTMGIGFLLFSWVQELWQFYLAFMVITLGSGLGAFLAIQSAVTNWFIRRRTIALATTMSGVPFGGLLVPLLALGIESHGFHMVTRGIGVVLIILALTMTRLIRNRPEEYGQRPDGDPPESATMRMPAARMPYATAAEPEFTVRQALLTPPFWFITVAHVSSSVGITTLAVHLVPRLTDPDLGLSLGMAGLLVTLYTAVAVPFQFLSGFLADRFSKLHLLFLFMFLQAAGIMVIAVAPSIKWTLLFAVLYGIGFGGRLPLFSAILADYFGRKAFPMLMGTSRLPSNLLMIGAPLLAGYIFDVTGSYLIPFTALAVFNFLGGGLILFIRQPRNPAEFSA